jgi:hypothetical protein
MSFRSSDLITKLKWRYATKKMDPPVPEDKLQRILERFA